MRHRDGLGRIRRDGHAGSGRARAGRLGRVVWLLLCTLPLSFVVACTRRTNGATPAPGESAAGATEEPRKPAWPAQLEELASRAREEFGAPTLGVEELEARRDDYLLVDVRPTAESQVSTIQGALLLDTDAKRSEFLTTVPDRPVVVFCTAGWRSAEFTTELERAGLEAFNLEGGICAWAAAEQPIVDAAGQPTRKIHSFSADFAGCVPEGYVAVED